MRLGVFSRTDTGSYQITAYSQRMTAAELKQIIAGLVLM